MRTSLPGQSGDRGRARRRVVAIAVGALSGGAAYAGIASAELAGRADDHAARPSVLIERAACATVAAPPPPAGRGTGQQMVVTVRPTALVQVDARGRIVAAWTNTGCAPRRTDDVYVQRPDGTIRAGGRHLTARRWTGDFREPGVLVAQTATGQG